jgi:hypothetical protein
VRPITTRRDGSVGRHRRRHPAGVSGRLRYAFDDIAGSRSLTQSVTTLYESPDGVLGAADGLLWRLDDRAAPVAVTVSDRLTSNIAECWPLPQHALGARPGDEVRPRAPGTAPPF